MKYSEKEAAQQFITTVKALSRYWAEVAKDKADAVDGLGFSVLSLIDGCNASSPGFDLMPVIHPDDRAEGVPPYVHGKAVNRNTMMHELFHRAQPRALLGRDAPMHARAEMAVRGRYTAIKAKLAQDDARDAYVTGPCESGRIAPLASFWRWEEAVRWAEFMDKEDKAEATSAVPAGND
jgi:hypothetical protein